MTPLELQGLAADLGLSLLHSLWQVALVAAALWGLLTLLHRASPNLRHALALAALALAVLWPASTFRQALRTRSAAITAIARGPLVLDGFRATAGSPLHQRGLATKILALSRPALPWLALAWAGGVLVLGLRLGGGWLWLRSLRRKAAPAPEWLLKMGGDLARRMGIRLPALRVSSGGAGPFSYGVFYTVVVLPAACLAQMDARELEALLAHEFAHLRRLDFLVNALQSGADLLLFHHPLAHWISSVVRLERERCCDLAAVQICGDVHFYASVLDRLDDLNPGFSFAFTTQPTQPSLALPAQGASLMIRIRHLLGAKPRPAFPALLGSALLLSALTLAAAAPFRDGAQGPAILVPAALLKQVDAAAKAEGIDADLMRAMIQCESRFDPSARSPLGALGLMQLMPQTATRFGAKDPLQVDENLKAGASYLRFLLDHYNGDTARAVTAYNAGEQAVDRSSGIAPTEESRLYALAVMSLYRDKGVQATEGREGVQIIQGSLEPAGNGTFNLSFTGWLMGRFEADVVQAGDPAKSLAHLVTRGDLSTTRISPKIAFQADPGKGALKITFKDFGSKRQGEAVVPLDSRAFTVTLAR